MLDGQRNFRDLGGVHTADGALVATGEVYRSGELSALTDDDLTLLEELGIRTVVDLRSEREAEIHPDRLPDSVVYRPMPILPGGDGSGVERFMQTFDPDDFPPWEIVYRDLIRDHIATVAALFGLVVDPAARPLVFHCSAGKDRTGVVAALLLTILGVAWEDVEDDFMLTNEILRPARHEIMDRWVGELERRGVRLTGDASKRMEHLLLVERSYLEAARAEMIACCGSVDGYIEDRLAIDDDGRDELRRQLLR
jgi:protein-tyrosine phosphatase